MSWKEKRDQNNFSN